MSLLPLVSLSLSVSFAALIPAQKPALPEHASDRAVERRLRGALDEQRKKREALAAAARAIIAGDAPLKDAVASAPKAEPADAPDARRTLNRLPGMSAEPFNLCPTLERCAEAPLSLHVDDEILIPDAMVALARPWIALEKARGAELTLTPEDHGRAVTLARASGPAMSLQVSAVPTGGFDVWLKADGDAAAQFSAERAAVLK